MVLVATPVSSAASSGSSGLGKSNEETAAHLSNHQLSSVATQTRLRYTVKHEYPSQNFTLIEGSTVQPTDQQFSSQTINSVVNPPTPPPRAKSNHSDTPLTLFSHPWANGNPPQMDSEEPDVVQNPSLNSAQLGMPFPPSKDSCPPTFLHQSSRHNGLMASVYMQFRISFWIDRLLLWTGVYVPMILSLLLILIHAFLGVSRCLPHKSVGSSFAYPSSYIDKACGLQLSFNVLQGRAEKALVTQSSSFLDGHSQASLQHECYPFLLLIIALLMWAPHYIWLKCVEPSARRDLCFIRGELNSFRESLAREIAMVPFNQASGQTMNCSHPNGGNGTFMNGTAARNSTLLPGYNSYRTADGSGRMANGTVGGGSFISPPPPQAQHGGLLSPPAFYTTNSSSYNPVEADFSAPGLAELPYLQSCQNDWSLNTYLSNWQNTEYYWRRYVTKHFLIGLFQLTTIISIIVVVSVNRGAPFAALFKCELNLESSSQALDLICMLQTTFLANMSVLCFGFLSSVGLAAQCYFFYRSFYRDRAVTLASTSPNFFGIGARSVKHTMKSNFDCERCFFGDYIRLLAFAAFREPHKEIRNLTVTLSPTLFRSDFHLISLMCLDNLQLFPDALHIHFWMERYARLVRRKAQRPCWLARRSSVGQLVRCEDLSVKFNFSKIRVKLEVSDSYFS